MMKRFITFVSMMTLLLMLAMSVFSQEITVRFTGQINGTDYCRLDRVVVTNLTRNWSETLEYPDTIIVLGSTVGANLNIAAVQGLGQNIPNPFDCETHVELSLSQSEDVRMQLLDVAGKVYAEYNGSLNAGMHIFDISAANPQAYLLNATVGDRKYSIRMVNVGSGCGCSIKYAGVSGGIEAKLTTANEFQTGDNMCYIGYAIIGGENATSATVEQSQVVNQNITLDFTHYSSPRIETLAATDITTSSATLRGNILDNGGATIVEKGFVWGISAEDLTETIHSSDNTDNFEYMLTGLDAATVYYYKAYASNSIGTSYGELMSFTTFSTTGTANGHDWVDLGLPSGTRWATCNVGSDTPEGYGNYYAWGETTVKNIYEWSTYRYCRGDRNTLTKYCNSSEYGNDGFTDALTTLEVMDDAATANWGEEWRIPTKEELEELNSYCSATWTTQNGVHGCLFVGPNGNSVFLPAAGHRYSNSLYFVDSRGDYWSSSLYTDNPNGVWKLSVFSDGYNINDDGRDNGFAVRPVCSSSSIIISVPTVTTIVASNITTTSATILGNVIYDGGAIVTERGFLYGTSQDNLSQIVQCGTGMGNYSASITGLTTNVTYYYKAYATNAIGTGYGEVMTFSTVAVRPTVITDSAANITTRGASLYGNIISDGGTSINEFGFVYGTSSNNFIYSVRTNNGTVGRFMEDLTNLSSNTTYYYKAFATNSTGTSYGEVKQFTTNECNCGEYVADYDGNTYSTVQIGEQCWMAQNLKTTHFANGTSILLGSSTSSTTAYRHYPNNNGSNVATYGYLYNWSAAMNGANSSSTNPSNVQGICPNGWHLPSDAEWTQLTDYLNSQSEYQCGGTTTNIAKSLASTTGWNSSTKTCAVGNTPANNNSTGFGALPAGNFGNYNTFGYYASFWSATEGSSSNAYYRSLYYNFTSVIVNDCNKYHGFSVRCVKD